MKSIIFILTLTLLTFAACNDLDLYPLSEGSSETWYSNENEMNLALNDLYRRDFWPLDADEWTDDWTYREAVTEVTGGTINGEWSTLKDWWKNSYKAITRANTILANLDRVADAVSEETLLKIEAEARFNRAAQYARLISHFGDVIYYTEPLDLEESFTLSRTDEATVLQAIYDDYDFAIENLPQSYGSSELQRATKGGALALKARIALYKQDYAAARDAAKACIDLGIYELYPDFAGLFISSTKNSVETIFAIPQSVELGQYFSDTQNYIVRNAGGWAAKDPSWDLFCSFLCSDGLPIDESPLFNPQNPFENRDPRTTATIVEFQTPHLGFMYQPHPDSLEVLNLNTGNYQTNNDNRVNAQYASYNGLVWKKGIDADWSDDLRTDPDRIIVRYADVLLMYAEAKIELGEIDQTVLDAINAVRARAYGVSPAAVTEYPTITVTSQAELRQQLRIERRMEFALEGRRYMDIIRWKLAEKVLNKGNYGMLDPDALKEKVVDPGLWFYPETPPVDEDGVPDFSAMYDAGLIKLLAKRQFDPSRQYLWPIPTKEILINENLSQNPGY